MNQPRISWTHAVAFAVCFIGSGALFALWQATKLGYGALLFSMTFLFLGVRELLTLMQRVNTWQFNPMPSHYEDLPVGSWEVIGTTQHQHIVGDNAVYVIIAIAEGFRRSICAVRIPFAWVDIRDAQILREGRQPFCISIGACIRFMWVELEEAPSTSPTSETK